MTETESSKIDLLSVLDTVLHARNTMGFSHTVPASASWHGVQVLQSCAWQALAAFGGRFASHFSGSRPDVYVLEGWE
jgi:hypothetical protein